MIPANIRLISIDRFGHRAIKSKEAEQKLTIDLFSEACMEWSRKRYISAERTFKRYINVCETATRFDCSLLNYANMMTSVASVLVQFIQIFRSILCSFLSGFTII